MSTMISQSIESQDSSANEYASRNRKRLLLISYHFPPVGGAGVQRPVKFVKYLRRFGWDVSVLMAANPSVPVFDNSLLVDIPEDTLLERARTWEPDYALKKNVAAQKSSGQRTGLLTPVKSACRKAIKAGAGLLLQPDAQILWYPNALKAGKKLLRSLPHDAIMATAPPYSNLILAKKLKQIFQIPFIADFRDEWDLSSKYLENHQQDRISNLIQTHLQKSVMKASDAIVATTQASTERLLSRAHQFGTDAIGKCIYNGFDQDDFDLLEELDLPQRSSDTPKRFRIIYTGTLWNLTTVEPLVKAVESIHQVNPELLNKLEFQFIGRKTPEQLTLLERIHQTDCTLVTEEYCAHQEALKKMGTADALCLLLSDVEGANRVAPAKLFEYLATKREILSITPAGETAHILNGFWPAGNFRADDTEEIALWLTERLNSQTASSISNPEKIDQFNRESQAGELAELLGELVQNHT
ncbi:glycosyltransferase family 4 protein [Gimesia aquarii]|uniref:Glycosyltransferase subfamily 4-like N-terminal domain-containing protein n=1 Tax=Gimesia aquarii TaxID=2527964 RepID=A0A517X084_9PLAN|nr:glycosyltransferase family 4 protein [Gimesia aquarii]QDU10913.1 hypothetical protein V202x_43270 [Gimesia aquarii]